MSTVVKFMGERATLSLEHGKAIWACKKEPVLGEILTAHSLGLLVSIAPNSCKQLAYDLAAVNKFVEVIETEDEESIDPEVVY